MDLHGAAATKTAMGAALACAVVCVTSLLHAQAHAPADAGAQGDAGSVAASLDEAEALASRGHVIEALKKTHDVLGALASSGAPPAEAERTRALARRLHDMAARVTFTLSPSDVTDVAIEFDNRAIAPGALGKTYSVNPGEHVIRGHAVGKDKQRLVANQTLFIKPGETTNVTVAFGTESPFCTGTVCLTPTQLTCMKAVKTAEEEAACACGGGGEVGQRPGCHACAIGRGSRASASGLAALAVVFATMSLRRRRRASS